jgi:hypothetical protein
LTVATDSSVSSAPELRALLERHPRASWREQASPTVQFWLDVHDGFRRDCVALESAGDDYRAGRLRVTELAVHVATRLRGMLAHLHGHHEVEDHHYFPAFRDAAPGLAGAFDSLAADHAALAEDARGALAAVADLVAAADAGADSAAAAEQAARRYLAIGDKLCRRLVRHLDDEELLIIPLLIDRGA